MATSSNDYTNDITSIPFIINSILIHIIMVEEHTIMESLNLAFMKILLKYLISILLFITILSHSSLNQLSIVSFSYQKYLNIIHLSISNPYR
jgi:hypothetical protein